MNAFAILAHPIRFRIVEILASGAHLSGNISDVVTVSYGVGRAAVSKHLAILRDNGWVDVHEEGPERWYFLRDDWWRSLEHDLDWLKYLWKRRIGVLSKNETDPALASTADRHGPHSAG